MVSQTILSHMGFCPFEGEEEYLQGIESVSGPCIAGVPSPTPLLSSQPFASQTHPNVLAFFTSEAVHPLCRYCRVYYAVHPMADGSSDFVSSMCQSGC